MLCRAMRVYGARGAISRYMRSAQGILRDGELDPRINYKAKVS